MVRAGRLTVATAALALTLGGFAGASPSTASPVAAERATYIVTVDSAANATALERRAEGMGGQIGFRYRTVMNGFSVELPAAAAAALAATPGVTRVEQDQPVSASSNTTQNNATWGLDRSDQTSLPLNGTYKYPATAGSTVNAYIIDTGIRASHVEFGGRVGSGFTAISDKNGTNDCNGHGTHVSGTVGGTTYGIAKAVSLYPVRVLDCRGSGSWSGVVAGLDWVANNAKKPAVANMSLGGGASTSVDAAVNRLITAGVTVVVAAGNDNLDACNYSPARVPNAITVGASTSSDGRSSFSNFGSCVDIFAPGSSITSAWYSSNTATNTISGTSMASPHVAGAAALVLGAQPSLSPSQVAAQLVNDSTKGVVSSEGTNSPNRLLFVAPASSTATAPGAPTDLTATRGNASANLTWTAPSDGGSPITGYSVSISPVAGSVSVTGTSASITGLTNGVAYTVSVRATNAVGTGPASSAVTVTPATVPGAPKNVSASASKGTATITWQPPDSNGGSVITGYDVTVGSSTSRVGADASSYSATGLTNGATYSVSVAAVNSVDVGPAGTASVTLPDVPGAPSNVVATPGDVSATVTWDAPLSNGGSAVTGYTVTVSPAGTVSVTGMSASISGLTNGTAYTVSVSATNAIGTGETTSVTVTPAAGATVPSAPRNVKATATDSGAVITWDPPSSDGGSAVTGYDVTVNGTTAKLGADVTRYTASGLTNGTAYDVSVLARNTAGAGPASTTSVTPATKSSAPLNVSATAGDASATITWDPPSSNGGSDILGYTVTVSPAAGSVSISGTSASITGLTNGTTYTVSVVARNAMGDSSAATTSVTPVAPLTLAAPTNVVVTSKKNGLSIAWSYSGTLAPTSYTANVYNAQSGGSLISSCTATGTSCTVNRLTNGVQYWVDVSAVSGSATATSSPRVSGTPR